MSKLIEKLRLSRAAPPPPEMPPVEAWSQLRERLVAEGITVAPAESRWKKALSYLGVLVGFVFLFTLVVLPRSGEEDDLLMKTSTTNLETQGLVVKTSRSTTLPPADVSTHSEMMALENAEETAVSKNVIEVLNAAKSTPSVIIAPVVSPSEQGLVKPNSESPLNPEVVDSVRQSSVTFKAKAIPALAETGIPYINHLLSFKLPVVINEEPARPKRPTVPARWEITTSGALIDNGGSSNLSSNFSGRYGAFQLGEGSTGANGIFVTDEGEELYWVGVSQGRTTTPIKFNSFYFRGGLSHQTSWGVGGRAYLGYYRFRNLGQRINPEVFNNPFGNNPDLFTKQYSNEQKIILGTELSYTFLRRRRVQPYLALGIAFQVYDLWQMERNFTVPATGQRGLVDRQRIIKWWDSEPSFSATGGINYRLSSRWSVGVFVHTINLFENVVVPPVGLEARYLLN